MKRTRLALLASAAALCASPCVAEEYTFSIVAETSSFPGSQSLVGGGVNDSGTVVFQVSYGNQSLSSVYTSSGGVLTPILLSSFLVGGVDTAGSINSSDTVVVHTLNSTTVHSIRTGNGGPPTTIASSSGPVYLSFANNGQAINDAGTVATWAGYDAGGSGIVTFTNGIATDLAKSVDPLFSTFGAPRINNSGTVVFQATLDAGGSGIFAGTAGDLAPLALSSDPQFLSFNVVGVAINDAGLVAFYADLEAGGAGIFTSDGETTTPIVATNEHYPLVSSSFGMNNAGEVAFWAFNDAGTHGVYFADGTDIEPIVLSGDPLFGSAVESASVSSFCLNDAGQVAFSYRLTDGRRGMALATPIPEPTSALLLAVSAFPLLLRRRARL